MGIHTKVRVSLEPEPLRGAMVEGAASLASLSLSDHLIAVTAACLRPKD